jgi:glycine/D-amino acid oxidase-like deaminating enzyme
LNETVSELPARTTVAVVGASLSALALADALGTAGGATVLLTDARELRGPSPSLGVVRVGPTIHLARLAAGHGPERAAACVRAGLNNRSLLERLGAACGLPVRRRGTLRFASGADEAAEVQRSAQLLERLDRPARFADVQTFVDDAPARFTHAALHSDDASVDADALAGALARRVEAHDVRVMRDTHLHSIEDDHEVRLITSRGTLRAEVVVVAAEDLLASLVSFCRFKIVPMRTQVLTAVAPVTADETRRHASPDASLPDPPAWSAAHGYENWRHEDGTRGVVHVSGSRSLPVKRELGTRGGTTPEVQALLEANLRDFARLRRHHVARRWSTLQGISCDGLPIVGAVPGRARVLVCGGFGVNDVGWAFVAARTLVDLLARGRSEHDAVLSPRRFL